LGFLEKLEKVISIQLHVLFEGFPGSSSRGFLGWSLVALIKTEKRTILFDTGGYNERQTLLNKLGDLHIYPNDIDTLILSHLHFDHIVNFGLFPHAEIVVHKEELEHVLRNKDDIAVPHEVLPSLFTRKITIVEGKIIPFDEMIIIHTPGHTPGHQSLLIEQDGRVIALAADAIKNITELKTGKVMMTRNMEDTLTSMQLIKEKAHLIYPGHDSAIRIVEGQAERLGAPQITISSPPGFYLTLENNTLIMKE
jgi:N-acyl homoserine lactone hydrolase